MGRLFIGCSGWNYGTPPEEDGGWVGVFYPNEPDYNYEITTLAENDGIEQLSTTCAQTQHTTKEDPCG